MTTGEPMADVKLISIATALPPQELAQEAAFAMARSFNCESSRDERVLQRLYKRTTIEKRRTVLSLNPEQPTYSHLGQPGTAARMSIYKEEAPRLAIEATQSAMVKAQIKPEQIGNLVTVSCTGFFAPGIDTQIIERLALPRQVGRTHVGFMGCSGALNGLRVAAALTRDSLQPTLLVATELCSLHFQYGCKSDDVLANALFGDGAAAVLLAAGLAHEEQTGGEAVPNCRLLASGSYLIADTKDAMTWEIGDHGFSMTLDARVPSLIEQNLRPWLAPWLEGYGIAIEEVAAWAIHPGGPRVLDAVQDALSLSAHHLLPSRQILSRLGNMSSPTILFIVQEILRLPQLQSQEGFIVALAFGPGLTIEAAILEVFSGG